MKYQLEGHYTNETHFALSCEMNGRAFMLETDWQGCSNLYCDQPIHICELQEFTTALQEMKERARIYFDGEFCVGTLTPEMVKAKIAEYTANDH